MSTATITSKGQVTIPKDVRDRLGLRAGVKLVFLVQPDGSVLVRPKTRDVAELFGLLRSDRHVTTEEMDQAIRDGWAGAP